ncbi:hypothetical protein ACQR14_36000, partial [Bradyrhizobium oligotrophicum]|uniref:hypothetical protein n=1 Tax=Bradyrhizobium oligotrophicum TaxID=44255 RepID=UPI003EBDC8D6
AANARFSLHEPPRNASAAGVSYVPVGIALIAMDARGVVGGSGPTSICGTSSRTGAKVHANQDSATRSNIASPNSVLLIGWRRIRAKRAFPPSVAGAIDPPFV